tara:strand:+ start:134 stop:316 length:183 start_codon:yes stop_codon:yes gene_type:complete
MRELQYYSKVKNVIESCCNYNQLLNALKYYELSKRFIEGNMYIKELNKIARDKSKKLFVK